MFTIPILILSMYCKQYPKNAIIVSKHLTEIKKGGVISSVFSLILKKNLVF